MVSPGAVDIHLQGDTHIVLHPGDDRLYPGVDAAEDQGWLQHPPPCGRRDNTVWGEAEALQYHSGVSGTSPSAPDPQPIGTARLRHAQCQRHHRQGGRAGVTAFWEGLPPHPADGLGGGPGPESVMGVQNGSYRCVPPCHH